MAKRKKLSARKTAEVHFAIDQTLVLAMKPWASKCLTALERAVKTGKFDKVPAGWDEFKDIREIVGYSAAWREWLRNNKRIMRIVDFDVEQLIDLHINRISGKKTINLGGSPKKPIVKDRWAKMRQLMEEGKKPREIAALLNLGAAYVRKNLQRIRDAAAKRDKTLP